VYFRRVVKPVKPRTVMAVDLNFDNVTLAVFTLNCRLIKLKRFRTPLKKVLTHRIQVERVQRRYFRSWRFIKGVRRVIERYGESIRSISWDYVHKLEDYIAELASKHSSVVVLEDLDKLRDNNRKGRKFNKKLGLWFYRRARFCIEYEVKERDLEVVKVSPRGTSTKCPKCSRLVNSGHRTLRCSKCDFTRDRDVVATVNLYRKSTSNHPRCGGLGAPSNAPEPMRTRTG
jgi:putative transposase